MFECPMIYPRKPFYCCSDGVYYYLSEIPKTLREFLNSTFQGSNCYTEYPVSEFESFNKKFKNVIKKQIPDGYEIIEWIKGYFYCSGMLKDDKGRYIYFSIPDVRHWTNEWVVNILIRTAKHKNDWTGGINNYTNIMNFGKDILNLYK